MIFAKTNGASMDLGTLSARMEQHLRDHRGKYILQGVLFIVFGILAAALPAFTALNVTLLIGAVLLATGILQLFFTFRARTHWWSLLSAALSIVVGLLVLWRPLDFLLALVTLIAIFMTIEGIFELLLALEFRAARNWGWMFLSGAITLVLAVLLWLGYPTIGIIYLGWIVAINFIFYGMSLLMLVWRVAGNETTQET